MSEEPRFQRYVSRRNGHQQTFDVAPGGTPSSFWVRRINAPDRPEGAAGAADAPFEVSWHPIGHGRVLFRIGGRVRIARIVQSSPTEFLIEMDGRLFPMRADDEITARALHQKATATLTTGPVRLLAPMPGTIVNVLVDEGETVAKGQAVLVIEAMKMQNELGAPVAGRVRGLMVHAGQAVEARARLCEIEP